MENNGRKQTVDYIVSDKGNSEAKFTLLNDAERNDRADTAALNGNKMTVVMPMDFDAMLEELGEMGRFQITTYLLICLPVLFAAANSLSYVFTAGIPNYRCYVPNCDNLTDLRYSTPWAKYAIPSFANGNYKPSLCSMYTQRNATRDDTKTCSADIFTEKVIKCTDWIFEDDELTIVQEWNITCLENQWKLSLVGTMHFAGIVVGSALFGALADRYGRKLIFVVCILLMCVSGVAQVWSPTYTIFILFIFINALGTSGVYPLAFIIGVELVGKRKRDVTGIVLNYFYAVGEALVALFAWISKDWQILQLICSAPPIIFVLYYWFVPESVRWLLAKKYNKRAKGIMQKAAKANGVVLSSNLMANLEQAEDVSLQHKQSSSAVLSIKEMFHCRKLVVRFMIVYFIWATNAFVFYGLSVNSTSMSGNKYVNFTLICLIEIPGYTLAWICMQRFGRRISLAASLILCGVTCGAAGFVPTDTVWPVTVLFLIGKLGVTSAFGLVYVHTAEMLPTIIRSGGVGSASTVARIGAMLAPFVPLLGVYVEVLPMILFGTVSITAGLLALCLPETLGTQLPETVEDAKRL